MGETKLKYIEFQKDIKYLKDLEKRLEKVEGGDDAMTTYYVSFQPSELIYNLLDFIENGNSNHYGY